MNKTEAYEIALSIMAACSPPGGRKDISTYLPDPNDYVAALRDIVRENPKILAAMKEFDDGDEVLAGLGIYKG